MKVKWKRSSPLSCLAGSRSGIGKYLHSADHISRLSILITRAFSSLVRRLSKISVKDKLTCELRGLELAGGEISRQTVSRNSRKVCERLCGYNLPVITYPVRITAECAMLLFFDILSSLLRISIRNFLSRVRDDRHAINEKR